MLLEMIFQLRTMQISNPNILLNKLALLGNDVNYFLLLENMPNALCYCKILFDDDGKPVDLKILQVNQCNRKNLWNKKIQYIGKENFRDNSQYSSKAS